MRAELPLDAEGSGWSSSSIPTRRRSSPSCWGGPLSVRELSEIAENMVKDRLERLPGVGSIEIIGSRRREVRIWLDPVRLAGYGLSIDDVRSTLLLENAETAGGRVEGREREWTVTTSGRVKRVEDFGALIAAERGGRLVYLRDVAKIEGRSGPRSAPWPRFNGQRGVSLEVRRRSGDEHRGRRRGGSDGSRGPAGPTCPPGMEVLITRDMGGVHRGFDLLRLLQHALGRPAGGRGRPPVPAQPKVDPHLGAGDPLLRDRVVHGSSTWRTSR